MTDRETEVARAKVAGIVGRLQTEITETEWTGAQ